MADGTIVRFNEQKGTGFIKPDDGGREVFLHKDYVKPGSLEHLKVGSRVTFTPARGYQGPKAKDVRVK